MEMYTIDGVNDSEMSIDYDACIKGVNHRGYSVIAPENTLPAYILSKKMGFKYVETDISFTSDGVAVLLHDSTIDRTSNGTGSIASMTYAQVLQYDFGSWKSSAYAGTKIPTLNEFLALCKAIMLHPYLELKAGNKSQILQVVDAVSKNGMNGKVSYISYSSNYLGYVKAADPYARLGYLRDSPSTDDISICQGLKVETNEVFYSTGSSGSVNSTIVSAFSAADIPIEVWTVDSETSILRLNPYVTGVTSNSLIAGKVLYDSVMNPS